ncbi:hypothetical protein AB0877_14685 [Micromonospora sp. NPDC047644]|uniref:hypothetical protein n=1 Tax=Micromonospora sp. NPDC047644 TaxID=3157203 RepID=UPI0034524086
MTSRLRRLARLLVLIAAAAGAGFVVAVLFQGPAAANGMRSGSGDEPHRTVGVLVESVTRLTVAERPHQGRHLAPVADDTRLADDSRRDKVRTPLARPTGDAAAPREKPPATQPRGLTGTSRRDAPVPPRAAAEREKLRPAAVARTAHRPAHRVGLSQPAADPPRKPATAAPPPAALHLPGESPVVGPITAALPYVVDVVSRVPIRPVVMTLLRVADAVLPPALGEVVVPSTTPALPGPPAPGPGGVPVTETAPALPAPTPPAGPTPVSPAAAPVRAAVPPMPAAPPPMSAVAAARAAVPTGHLAARPKPLAPQAVLSGQPVTPADEDVACVDNGSTPGPGLARPLERQSHVDAGPPADLVPLLVESRTLSPITRPG